MCKLAVSKAIQNRPRKQCHTQCHSIPRAGKGADCPDLALTTNAASAAAGDRQESHQSSQIVGSNPTHSSAPTRMPTARSGWRKSPEYYLWTARESCKDSASAGVGQRCQHSHDTPRVIGFDSTHNQSQTQRHDRKSKRSHYDLYLSE